jgi:hypothetical protein
MKCVEFIYQLSDYELLKNDSVTMVRLAVEQYYTTLAPVYIHAT